MAFVGDRRAGQFIACLSVAVGLGLVAFWGIGAVHATGMAVSGEASVTETGAARYEMPIAVPPGTAGMAPSLTLAYDSQSGNGILGMGFQLEGLSAIERCARTHAQDGVAGRIAFNADDRFCLNGQRLIAISGTYGADGTEYRTEIESFAKVVSYGTAGTGPGWFKVWTKAGQIIEFGNTTDTRILAEGKSEARLWAANKVSDRKGNYYAVSYVNDNATGEAYPSRIDFTGNDGAGLAPHNSVRFVYQTGRPEAMTSYLEGSLMTTGVRLINIQTFNGESLISDYRLSYAQGTATNRSQLTSIALCDPSDACLPATSLTWQQGGDGTVSFSEIGNPIASGGDFSPPDHVDDFNSDGRTDFMSWRPTNGWNTWFINTGTETGQVRFTRYDNPIASGRLNDSSEHLLGDWNGDGFIDVLGWHRTTASKRRLYLNDGAMNFTEVPISLVAGCSGDGCTVNYPGAGDLRLDIGDWNGDGLSDFVIWDADADREDVGTESPYTPGVMRIYSFLTNKGNGLFEYDNASSVTGFYNGSNLYFIDLNNDNLTDVINYKKGENSSDREDTLKLYINNHLLNFTSTNYNLCQGEEDGPICSNGDLYFGDWNGDKIIDLMRFYSSFGAISLFIGRGNSQFEFVDSIYSPPNNSKIAVGDFNGDNISDFMTYRYRNSNTKWFIGNGDNSFNEIDLSLSQFNVNQDVSPFFTHWNGTYPHGYALLANSGDTGSDNKWFSNANKKPDLLLSITNGLGKTVTFTYTPMTDASVYTKDSGAEAASYPTIDLQMPSYLVSRLDRSDGIGGLRRTDYHYTGAKADLLGRGFLGFREVASTDQQTGIIQKSTYHQDYPFIGLVAQKMRSKDGVTLSVQDRSYSATDLGGTRRQVVLSQSVESGADLTGTTLPTTTTTYQYDTFSNATEIAESTSDGYGKTTLHTYANDTANWLIGQLLTANVTGTAPDLASQPPASDATPDAFDFTDVTDATPGQLYEDSVTLSGFNQPITASVSAGGGEIRRNDTGSWETSLTVYPGDKLNLRMTSSASSGAMVTTTVTAGGVSADWAITTQAP